MFCTIGRSYDIIHKLFNRENKSLKKPSQQTIFSRLVISFAASVLVPTICIILLVIIVFYHNNTSKAQQQMEDSSILVANNIDSYLSEIGTITIAPYYHTYFGSQKTMDPSSASYASALNDFQTEMRSLLNLSNYSRSDILDLLVWSDGRYLYYILYNQTKYFQPTYQIEKQEWFDKVFRNNGKIIFASNYSKNKETGVLSGNSFDMVRNINNLVNREQKNLIILNVSTKYFDEQFEKMNLLFQSFVVITGGEGNIIYSSRPITANILRSIISKRVFRYDDTNWQVLTTDSNEFDLKVHVIYSLDDVKYQTSVLIGYILLISIGGIFLAVILFRHFNKWISSSAKAITSTFSELENGNLSARCPEVYVKEYNEIGHSVNKAITRLEEKIKNEYLLTIQQKTVQLYALQSQIQPHFLINTIYCFIALNQIGETEKLTNAFYQLSNLLRYVLSKKQFSTVGEELDFLNSYLMLHKLRFENRLEFSIECPKDAENIKIPRLLLQPIVENSVIHGIEPCEHPCYCNIKVELQDTVFTISIIDNGVGFDTSSIPDEKDSVGLYYIRERLKLWNERAKLFVESSDTTRVLIQIPMEKAT